MPPTQCLLLANSAALATSIGAAAVYLAFVQSPPTLERMVAKTASTTLLSATTVIRNGPSLLALALAFGSLGDAFLAWDDDNNEDDTKFLFGLASFLVAHLFYIAVFWRSTGSNGKRKSLFSGWRAVPAGVLVLFVSIMLASLVPQLESDLRVPVIGYSAVIFVMAQSALTLEHHQVIAGSLLFAASDSILAADRFLVPTHSPYRVWMQYAVWVLYYAGQLLIALGLTPL
ncbi:YhhN-like protein [Chaetomium sp. MPI-SDFR-AT-0129]|nr:YhhN-like protein [Chaetomium sp. MPI-SDFR-AT-0129]